MAATEHGVVLVLNAGSSSLKFSVFRLAGPGDWRLDARGQADCAGPAPRLVASDGLGCTLADDPIAGPGTGARTALDALAAWLRASFGGVQVRGVGHRIVHGGSRFAEATLMTPAVFDELTALTPLAPLHQPHNLAAIEAVSARLPDVPQVACFDTAFHRTRGVVSTV